MFEPGDVISYLEMCQEEGVNLQRGMNFHLNGDISVILMSLRPNTPYADRIEDEGRVLVYEGHDVPKTQETSIPKIVDQPMKNNSGTFTQNGLFYEATRKSQKGTGKTELVKVYEKLHSGIWVFNGVFELVDAWQEKSKDREVFKFKLQLVENREYESEKIKFAAELNHNRLIPGFVFV